MDNSSKLIAENGCVFIDSSITNSDIYMIYVASDATFTVLNESKLKGGSETDVMGIMNLTGKTIPAGVTLTPYDEVFSDITITSGSIIGYKLGR